MNSEQVEIYDRNMRVWGKETQEKLLKTNCYIMNIHENIMSELIKNFILVGINVYVIKDDYKNTDINNIKLFYNNFSNINSEEEYNNYRDSLLNKLQELTSLIKIRSLPKDDFINSLKNIKLLNNKYYLFYNANVFTSLKNIENVIGLGNYTEYNKTSNINFYIDRKFLTFFLIKLCCCAIFINCELMKVYY